MSLQISSIASLAASYAPTAAASQTSQKFEPTSSEASKKESARELEAQKTKQEIEDFFKKMKEAGGALQYMVQSNMDKIKKIIDEKEKELKEKFGLNSQPPLEGEALKSAQNALQAAMKDFTKQLMDDLNDKFKHGKNAQTQKVESPLAKMLAAV